MTAPEKPAMTSNRPYLLRALYEWVNDNGLTPHLLVDASQEGLQVPAQSITDGRVVLNLAPRAVSQLDMGNRDIRFLARFGGVSQLVVVPLSAVMAIYAMETGQGMMLPDDGAALPPEPPSGKPSGPEGAEPAKRGGHLKIIK